MDNLFTIIILMITIRVYVINNNISNNIVFIF